MGGRRGKRGRGGSLTGSYWRGSGGSRFAHNAVRSRIDGDRGVGGVGRLSDAESLFTSSFNAESPLFSPPAEAKRRSVPPPHMQAARSLASASSGASADADASPRNDVSDYSDGSDHSDGDKSVFFTLSAMATQARSRSRDTSSSSSSLSSSSASLSSEDAPSFVSSAG